MARIRTFTLPTPDTEPDTSRMDDLLNCLPGGKHIRPHRDEGPFYVLLLSSWADPNWQAVAALAAHPPVATVPFPTDDLETAAVLVMPEFAADMVGWHVAEEELGLHERVVEAVFDTPPDHAQILEVLIAQIRSAEDSSWGKEERDTYADALADAAQRLEAVTVLATLTAANDYLQRHAADLDVDFQLDYVLTMLAALHHTPPAHS